MPAAELSRLQAQIRAISTQFNQPETFIKSLLKLLDLYKDSNFQTGNVARIESIIPTLHDPPLVLHELETHLASLTSQFPTPALQIADQLWKEKYLEARSLAIVILGNIPYGSAQPILDRLQNWVNPSEDNLLIKQCLLVGSQTLRKNNLDDWLTVTNSWLSDKEEEIKKIGLQAIQVILGDPAFENFPVIFSALLPVLQDVGIAVQKELLYTVEILVNRTPQETAAFLHMSLIQHKTQPLQIFIRRSLPLFEKTIQDSIKVDL